MPVVNGKLTQPDLVAQGGASGQVELVDAAGTRIRGFVAGTNETIFGPMPLALTAGAYSVTLTANANISPANTMYKRTWLIPGGVAEVDYFIVPAGGGPYQEAALSANVVPLATATPSTAEIVPVLRGATVQQFSELLFTTDAGVLDSTALTLEHGQVVMRGGTGSGARSSRRSAFLMAGTPGGYSRIRSRWAGAQYAGTGLTPQHGHVHGIGIQADGKRRGVVVSHDIVFSAPWVINLAIWESNADGSGFTVPAGVVFSDAATVSAAARTSNVVTLTVPTGHGFVANDVVTVDLADNSYDGTFVVTSVTPTTIVYSQTAANAGTTTGSVTLARINSQKGALVRNTSATDAVRASNVVTATVPAGHPFQVGDWLDADFTDNTYDGSFQVTELPSATQIRWRQAVADDASAGTGTLSKIIPYWLESEWRPGLLRVRVWPDVGVTGSGGPAVMGAPPWESAWAVSVNLAGAGAAQPEPLLGQGCALLGAHLSSAPTEVRYDSIVVQGITA